MVGDEALDGSTDEAAVPEVEGTRSRKLLALGSGAILITGVAGPVLLTASPAAADSFEVTNLDDSGAGSLRAAIESANTTAGKDTITFAAGLSGVISLASDLPDITEQVDLLGPGAGIVTVDGNENQLIDLQLAASGSTTISGLTLTDGEADNSDSSGGGVNIGPGAGDVTLADLVITDNYAGNDGGGVHFYSGADVTIARTVISNNYADGGGGALYADADHDSTLTIVDSTITGNEASGDGGGLYTTGLDVTITNSTISGNTADGDGGGIVFGEGDLTIVRSAIDGNDANGGGGGIYFYADSAYAFRLESSTVAGNSAEYYGGGLYISGWNGAPVTISNSTISGNTASQAGAIYGAYGGLTILMSTIVENTASTNEVDAVGGIQLSGSPDGGAPVGIASNEKGTKNRDKLRPAAAGNGELELVGTIVADNTGLDIGVYGGEPTATADHSILGDVQDGFTVTDLGGTQFGVADPVLGPLAANGGPTRTHAVLAGSPAIDAGPSSVPSFPGNEFDQRGPGYARVVNGTAEVGSFEIQADVPVVPTTPTTAEQQADVVVPRFTG